MLTNDCLKHIQNWYYVVLFLIFVILAGLVMIFRYFLRINKEGVELKHQSKDLDTKHYLNRERIAKLEEKNGKEQKEIDALKNKIEILEEVISKNTMNSNKKEKR